MAIPNEQFTPLRFFRSPKIYPLPETYYGYWYYNGEIVDSEAVLQPRSIIVPITDEDAAMGENLSEDDTFECHIYRETVYSFILVNELYEAPCFNLTIKAPNRRIKIVSDKDYFSNQYPDDVKTLAFDFKKFLRKGESITSTTWTAETEEGDDTTPEFILQGTSEIVGTESQHRVGNAPVDNLYKLTCEVDTDQSNTHNLTGFLLIREIDD